ncbi:Crp/Fnr family transcriptional regulator [Tabrizicola sp.]|uniref:Crp/Fnr family transcriptional regulator n=1 Tax=Tabrizicola sp. TaxID=2005166 RepID=UPI002735453C|nr:Crp/Fnr family transcriptional regulator [Tabrizicola sp.]MDP3194341.1 Crp/Fnr family transcriptional regulator [Tabrizicola sp.]
MSLDTLLAHDLPLFQGLSPADLAGIDLPITERHLGPWEILFNQKDQSRDVHFLLSGTLIALYWTTDGREVIFTRFGLGDHLGELAALDDGDRSLAVVARSEATVLTLPGATFRQLFDQVPTLRWRITQGLVARVRTLTARNLELTTYSVEQRVASYLFGLAVDRGALRVGGVIAEAPTHAEIAATIGSNREMVSRIMSGLAKRGAIKTARQRIELLDPRVLTAGF